MRRKALLLLLCCVCVVIASFILIMWIHKPTHVAPARKAVVSDQAATQEPLTLGSTDAHGTSDREFDRLLAGAVPNTSPEALLALSRIDSKANLTKRAKVMHRLTPYSQVEASLKEEIRSEIQGVTAEKIDDLLTKANQSEGRFWEKGDFDDISSFDDIYRARAMLELCLEADPASEKALKQLVEVLQAGWPVVLSDRDDKELVELGRLNQWSLYTPLWTLWERHLSAESDPSFENFERAMDLLTVGTPRDVYAAIAADYSKRNPSASGEEARDVALAASKARQLRIVDWALAVCQKKGKAWDVYADGLRAQRASIMATGFIDFSRPTSIVQESYQNHNRYMLGRLCSFRGPKARADQVVPLYKIRQ